MSYTSRNLKRTHWSVSWALSIAWHYSRRRRSQCILHNDSHGPMAWSHGSQRRALTCTRLDHEVPARFGRCIVSANCRSPFQECGTLSLHFQCAFQFSPDLMKGKTIFSRCLQSVRLSDHTDSIPTMRNFSSLVAYKLNTERICTLFSWKSFALSRSVR